MQTRPESDDDSIRFVSDFCLDSDMHLARTVFGRADCLWIKSDAHIKMTMRSELSVLKQDPLAMPARVHVFFPAVFAHKFRVRQIHCLIAPRVESRGRG